jgi:hypothetical protein
MKLILFLGRLSSNEKEYWGKIKRWEEDSSEYHSWFSVDDTLRINSLDCKVFYCQEGYKCQGSYFTIIKNLKTKKYYFFKYSTIIII